MNRSASGRLSLSRRVSVLERIESNSKMQMVRQVVMEDPKQTSAVEARIRSRPLAARDVITLLSSLALAGSWDQWSLAVR